MKTIFYALLLGCIPAGATVTCAHAQDSKAVTSISHPKIFEASVETLYASPKTAAVAGGASAINAKAIKNFSSTYKEVSDASWSTSKDGYMARFTANGIVNRTFYHKNGNWNFTILYYDEKNLPKDVRAIIKRVYYDYTITGVQEIRVEDRIVYLVTVEDQSGFTVLRLADGEMDVYQQYHN